jgi:hypothetical protein
MEDKPYDRNTSSLIVEIKEQILQNDRRISNITIAQSHQQKVLA